ncbi:hypothetical protein [Cerasicoccus maritimus]|uniref:hypothetical protein n=1 Tax=Cerasicoccus maritimus TaxID=490089 RepID=UPI0028527F25|nr:hypothetical protein [Cerasicoccus maritimus]
MKDRYPENFTIEIDRLKLRRYYQLASLWGFGWFFGIIGIVPGFILGSAWLDSVHQATLLQCCLYLGAGGVVGFIGGVLTGGILHLLFSHWRAKRRANAASIEVQGPFLKVVQSIPEHEDRKIHFRSITDFSVAQDHLMRWAGIHRLFMSTTGNRPVIVDGVKDAEKVRDILAEVDAIREV